MSLTKLETSRKKCKCNVFYIDSGVVRCRKCNKEVRQDIADKIYEQIMKTKFTDGKIKSCC